MSCKRYKLKTKSSCKKRFKITGTGKIMAACAFKRHGMRKRSNKFIRNSKGMKVLAPGMVKVIQKVIPYGLA